MIKFHGSNSIDYGFYNEHIEEFDEYKDQLQLTKSFRGLVMAGTSDKLGVKGFTLEGKTSYTTQEVEEQLNLAVLLVVGEFLDGIPMRITIMRSWV